MLGLFPSLSKCWHLALTARWRTGLTKNMLRPLNRVHNIYHRVVTFLGKVLLQVGKDKALQAKRQFQMPPCNLQLSAEQGNEPLKRHWRKGLLHNSLNH